RLVRCNPRRAAGSALCKDLADHATMHIRQPEIAPRVAIRQAFVIESQQMQHGGMQVVDGHRVLDRAEAELVSRPVNRPSLNSTTSHPQGKAPVVVITSLAGARAVLSQLDRRRSPELAGAQNERLVEQPA